jgi:olfactory receptor
MPMHFSIAHLSYVDICFTSVAVLKMLLHIQTQNKAISYDRCLLKCIFMFISRSGQCLLDSDRIWWICSSVPLI